MGGYYNSYWPPCVPVAERHRCAAKKVAKKAKEQRDDFSHGEISIPPPIIFLLKQN